MANMLSGVTSASFTSVISQLKSSAVSGNANAQSSSQILGVDNILLADFLNEDATIYTSNGNTANMSTLAVSAGQSFNVQA
jgi:hypothetical protein